MRLQIYLNKKMKEEMLERYWKILEPDEIFKRCLEANDLKWLEERLKDFLLSIIK